MNEADAATSADMVSDEELTALALAADPRAPLDPDAVAWHGAPSSFAPPLPVWYMPAPTAGRRRRGTTVVVVAICAGLFIISACGMCITSGFLSLA